ncbi:MAG: hypothetical protein RLZZ283_295 [Candidatus Parcubacteria bacterium]|jgi:hypothetical protein
MIEKEAPQQRSLPFYEIRGTFVRPGDYIKGTLPDGGNLFHFSGFIRSITFWPDGIRIHLEHGTIKITPAARAFVALSQYTSREKLHVQPEGDN